MELGIKIIAPTGCSGAGKTVLTEGILATVPGSEIMTSTTTRGPREGDPKGEFEHYNHEHYMRALKAGEFMSSEKLNPNPEIINDYYGIKKIRVENALRGDKLFVRSMTPNVIPVYWKACGGKILFLHIASPPEEEIRRRLGKRTGMKQEVVERRLRDEKNWDAIIDQHIVNGIPIHVLPMLSIEDTLNCALEIIRS